MTAHIPARPTPTPIPTPAPVEIPPLLLLAFEDPDKVDWLVAVADAESELGDVVVPVEREVVVLAVDTVDEEDVEVEMVVVDVLVVEDGGSSLLILKYADETSLKAVFP